MVRWFPLQGFSCPVSGCAGQKGSYDWICSNCGTTMYINETGVLECQDGSHSDQIIKWRFNCGNHGHHHVDSYKYADFQGFTFALSHAVQMMDKAGATWVGALCVELGKQYGYVANYVSPSNCVYLRQGSLLSGKVQFTMDL